MARRDKGIGGGTSRVREGMGGGFGGDQQKGKGVKQWNGGDMGWMGGVDEDTVK